MTVQHDLRLEDHLAWYDFSYQMGLHKGVAALPFIGPHVARRRRTRYESNLPAPQNQTAFGPRAVEISPQKVREYGEAFDFSVPWEEIALIGVSNDHCFFAHVTMNAIIVPMRSLSTTEREAILLWIQKNEKSRSLLRYSSSWGK